MCLFLKFMQLSHLLLGSAEQFKGAVGVKVESRGEGER